MGIFAAQKCKVTQQMDDWQMDFEWLRLRHQVKDLLKHDQLPNLNSLLLLIGIQELGRWKSEFTKEEKQDLMHIAACQLLSYEGYYEFEGRDADGWPHYKMLKPLRLKGVKEQEVLLKKQIIKYFKEREEEE